VVNKVILVGRLATDPDVKAAANGTHVAKFRLVTNSYAGKDDDGTRKEHAEFHSLVMFGRLAEVAGDYLRKGKLIYADGRLQTSSWEDPDGKKKYSTEVVVESFQILTPKAQEAAA